MKKTKKQKREDNIMLLVIFIPFLIYAIYDAGPPFIFYFDQKKGVAQIDTIKHNKAYFSYFHNGTKQRIVLSKRLNLYEKEKLKYEKKWPILYSYNFSYAVAFERMQKPDWLPPLIFILIPLIPIILIIKQDIIPYYKDYKEAKNK
ncbi:MAG: hypothetical protein ACPG5B_04135 [Chitinophagales bacterium]